MGVIIIKTFLSYSHITLIFDLFRLTFMLTLEEGKSFFEVYLLIFLHFKTTFIFSFMQIGFSKTIATPKMVLCNNDFSESSFCQILRNNLNITGIVSFSKLYEGIKQNVQDLSFSKLKSMTLEL